MKYPAINILSNGTPLDGSLYSINDTIPTTIDRSVNHISTEKIMFKCLLFMWIYIYKVDKCPVIGSISSGHAGQIAMHVMVGPSNSVRPASVIKLQIIFFS